METKAPGGDDAGPDTAGRRTSLQGMAGTGIDRALEALAFETVEREAASERSQPLHRDPNLVVVFGVTLMAVLGVPSITPAFPQMARSLGRSSQAVANLVTAFTLPGIFLMPGLGVLADRWGRERVLVGSLVVFGVAGGACALAEDLELLLALRFVQGIGAAGLSVLYITLIGDLYSGQERAKAMGYNASVLSVGCATYPALGGALATLGWRYTFLLALLAIPLGAAVVFTLESPEPRRDEGLVNYAESAWLTIREGRAVALFALSLLTFLVIYGAYLTYLPFLMEESFGASSFGIGLTMSSMSLATAFTSSWLGPLVALRSEKGLLLASCVLYALAFAAIPRAPRLWFLLMAVMLMGVAQGLSIPILQTLLAGMAPMAQRGVFMAVSGVALRLGQTVGPPLAGVAFGRWGIGGPFYAAAAVAAGMVVLVSVTIRKRRKGNGV